MHDPISLIDDELVGYATTLFALGGTGTPHADDFEAYGIHVIENEVVNMPGMLAQVSSCKDCSIEGNEVSDLSARVSGTDQTSTAVADADPRCAF